MCTGTSSLRRRLWQCAFVQALPALAQAHSVCWGGLHRDPSYRFTLLAGSYVQTGSSPGFSKPVRPVGRHCCLRISQVLCSSQGQPRAGYLHPMVARAVAWCGECNCVSLLGRGWCGTLRTCCSKHFVHSAGLRAAQSREDVLHTRQLCSIRHCGVAACPSAARCAPPTMQ